MSTRAELKRAYRETPKQAGIYQVKHTPSGRVLLGSSLDLHGPLDRHRFMLTSGSHRNPRLQADWKADGEKAFSFDILEVVKVKDDPDFKLADELFLLEEIWIERLQPFGERGYNEGRRIRDV